MADPIPHTSAPTANLKLREDLVIHRRMLGGVPSILVEDPIASKYYTLGLDEYRLVSALDGQTSVAEILSSSDDGGAGQSMSEEVANRLCCWLLEHELAHTADSAHPQTLATRARRRRRAQWRNRLNPLFIRVPIAVPDQLINKLFRWCSWLHTLPMLGLAVVLWCWAAWIALSQWPLVVSSARDVFSPGQRVGIVLSWLCLKLLHEMSHAVVCKKYGGYIRETGFLFILFTPIPYVDVTSSWRFRSKWQRIHTAAAGMYVELMVAAVAMIAWSFLGGGAWKQICISIVVAGSVTTVLFNANPLMRFDGYYILSDMLDIPNLYSEGQQYARSLLARIFLGTGKARSRTLRAHPILVRTYGLAAFQWRILVSLGIFIAAATLFHGAGLVLCLIAFAMWIVPGAWQLARRVCSPREDQRPVLLRFLTAVILLVACGAVINTLTWPGYLRAPAVIDYSQLTHVRAKSPGFVREICVSDGQHVRTGDILVLLENQALASEYASLKLDVARSETLCRQLHQDRKMAEYQAEQLECGALQQRAEQLRLDMERLAVHAPSDGTVIARDLDSRKGTYLAEGDLLCLVASDGQKEVRVSIAQTDVRAFTAKVGQSVRVRSASSSFRGKFVQIEPKASRYPPHESLLAINQGPLAVKWSSDSHTAPTPDQPVELLSPRFNGYVEVPSEMSSFLACGQRCTVSFHDGAQTIGAVLYRRGHRWLRERWHTPLP